MHLVLDSPHTQKSLNSMPLSPVGDKGIGKTICKSDDITSFAVVSPIDDESVLVKINDAVVVPNMGFLLIPVSQSSSLHLVRAISSLNSQVVLNNVYSESTLVQALVSQVKQSGKGGIFNLITHSFLDSYFLGSLGKPPPEYGKWYGVKASALCTVQLSSRRFICCHSTISVAVTTKMGSSGMTLPIFLPPSARRFLHNSLFLSRFGPAGNYTPTLLKVPCHVSFNHSIKFYFPCRLSAGWWCTAVGCEAKKAFATGIPITVHTEQYKFLLQFHVKCIYNTQEVSPKAGKPIGDLFSYTIFERLCVDDPFLNCVLSLSIYYLCQFVALLNPLRAKEAKNVAYLTLNVMGGVLNVLAYLNDLLYEETKEDAMTVGPNVMGVIRKRGVQYGSTGSQKCPQIVDATTAIVKANDMYVEAICGPLVVSLVGKTLRLNGRVKRTKFGLFDTATTFSGCWERIQSIFLLSTQIKSVCTYTLSASSLRAGVQVCGRHGLAKIGADYSTEGHFTVVCVTAFTLEGATGGSYAAHYFPQIRSSICVYQSACGIVGTIGHANRVDFLMVLLPVCFIWFGLHNVSFQVKHFDYYMLLTGLKQAILRIGMWVCVLRHNAKDLNMTVYGDGLTHILKGSSILSQVLGKQKHSA